ncbi:hypothetical protein V5O48_003187 [Marasmius crinis-equi]|uniref:Glucose-methanol-choline oxidoreductase N-terminal domain-containing protein n=1 Tax=Marasmius crinis-equi TaxID=585013 RepID=A0ABR3FTJ8_9AGAR
MAYVRGSSDDFDRYARVTEDPGWSWDALQHYFRKVVTAFSTCHAGRACTHIDSDTKQNERWSPPTDGHDTNGQFDPRVHGFHGINSVSLYGFSVPDVDSRVAALTRERPDLFPFNLDINSGSPNGIGWQQSTIKHGKRSSSFTSYLASEYLARPNLHVLINAQATRVLSHDKVFNAVEFSSSSRSGSLETPKLLMNSGIGDSEELSSHGIQPVMCLPDVGKNLSVHVGLGINYFVNSTDTADDLLRNATLREEMAQQWKNDNGAGRLGGNVVLYQAFFRLPDDAAIFQSQTDPSAGPNTPHLVGDIQVVNVPFDSRDRHILM